MLRSFHITWYQFSYGSFEIIEKNPKPTLSFMLSENWRAGSELLMSRGKPWKFDSRKRMSHFQKLWCTHHTTQICFHTWILIYACFVAKNVQHLRSSRQKKICNLLKINVLKPWVILQLLFEIRNRCLLSKLFWTVYYFRKPSAGQILCPIVSHRNFVNKYLSKQI